MGKKIKLREAQRRAAAEALCARLRAHSRTRPAAAVFIDRYGEFSAVYRARIEAYRAFALRAPELWRCRVRVRAPQARFLDLVRFTFAEFQVASHLEHAWTDELHAGAEQARRAAEGAAAVGAAPDFCHWYILAAQGRSLYREAANRYLSRRETHYFLNAPDQVTSTPRAFWYAVAQAATDDVEAALRVARSKISAFPVGWTFWKDVARFFARNPTSIVEMNDLIDFFEGGDGGFEPARGLPALRRSMEEWHRELRACRPAQGGSWKGRALPNARYESTCADQAAVWWIRQIKTADELFREGVRMHHCVVTYKPRCVSGEISIWSLTCEYPAGKLNRGLTIEVAADGSIVQCRGFANREPYANELAVVNRWASEHGLRC